MPQGRRVLARLREVTIHLGHITAQQSFKRTGPRFGDAAFPQAVDKAFRIFGLKSAERVCAEIHMAVRSFHVISRRQR